MQETDFSHPQGMHYLNPVNGLLRILRQKLLQLYRCLLTSQYQFLIHTGVSLKTTIHTYCTFLQQKNKIIFGNSTLLTSIRKEKTLLITTDETVTN